MRDLWSAMMDTPVVNFNVRKEFVMAIIIDLEDTLMTNNSGKIRIGEKVTTIMFADDLVLLADSSAGLKQSLLILQEYCKVWHLTINAEKICSKLSLSASTLMTKKLRLYSQLSTSVWC